MGKYTGKLDGLELYKEVEGGAEYQARVDLAKAEIPPEGRTPDALADRFIQLRHRKDKLEKELSRVNLHALAAYQLLQDDLKARGLKAVPFDSGATVRIDEAPHATYADYWCTGCDTRVELEHLTEGEGCLYRWRCEACNENSTNDGPCSCGEPRVSFTPEIMPGREVFRRFCLTHGYEREMLLPWATMNSLLSEAIAGGMPLPPGLKAWARGKAVITGLASHPIKPLPGFDKE